MTEDDITLAINNWHKSKIPQRSIEIQSFPALLCIVCCLRLNLDLKQLKQLPQIVNGEEVMSICEVPACLLPATRLVENA